MENINVFEDNFNRYMLPKYGNYRDLQNDLEMTQYLNQHDYYNQYEPIIDNIRVKYHDIDVYTIDPPNCTDADDAFSIFTKDDKLYLSIHIADPTHYISTESTLWNDILNRVLTHYPSNYPPIHMMPDNIVRLSSLMTFYDPEVKNAISVTFEIDKETYLPTKNIKLEFTELIVKIENRFTYKEASQLKNKDIFSKAILISQKLKEKRSEKTVGTKLSDLNIMIPSFDNNQIYISNVDSDEKLMKDMIGEFAILTNSYIAEFMKKNMNGLGIYRNCIADFATNTLQEISGEEILNKIIDEGIKADYSNKDESHDLVGIKLYTHFTSPMRRVSDCICHFLIKSYFCNMESPWTQEELEEISKRCYTLTKKEKSIQYDDQKHRIIQLLYCLSRTNQIKIKFRITGYTGLFLNCIISEIICNEKEYKVHVSYTLRNKDLRYHHQPNKYYTIDIKTIRPIQQYDEGSLIDLDLFIYNLFF